TDAVKNGVHTVSREPMNFRHEVLMPVIDWNTAQFRNYRCSSCRTGTVDLQPGEAGKLHKCRTYTAGCTVNQHTLASPNLGRTMQHLVHPDVIQNKANNLGGVPSPRDANPLPFPPPAPAPPP